MHDSTLDLFCNHTPDIDTFSDVVDDNQHQIETMRDAYWVAMDTCMNDGRPDDAVSIYSEWCVDGVDPEEGNYVFTFLPDLTEDAEQFRTLISGKGLWLSLFSREITPCKSSFCSLILIIMSPNFAEFLLDGADNGNEILAVLDDIVEVVETGGSDL